jgi:trk system potassium uptake protein TrkA
MRQYAVIGLGAFGRQVAQELSHLGVELVIVDRDRELLAQLEQRTTVAYCVDAFNQETINELIPPGIDAAIVDLGEHMEASILVTSYLKKIGVRRIIVKGESDAHAEILHLTGATRVVFPDREAAKRTLPLLFSSALFTFLPISRGVVVAEVHVPPALTGTSLEEADVRCRQGVNIVAMKKSEAEEYEFPSPDYRFLPSDILLVTGGEEKVVEFSGMRSAIRKRSMKTLLSRVVS